LQEIKAEALVKTLEDMKSKGYDYLKKITATDYIDHLIVAYIIYDTTKQQNEIINVTLPSDKPEIDTVIGVYKAADWYERELAEMFGISIIGRKTKRLLLEKWNGSEYPLRKSFAWNNPNYKRLE
jgi:NADH-quinone oxidoreductase subunit C